MARKVLIQILYGIERNLGALNPGELGYCTDTRTLYIGTSMGNVLLVTAQSAENMLKSIYDTDNDGVVDAAVTAAKLQVARRIELKGDVVGSVSFDGSQNVSIATQLGGKISWGELKGV
ncbi:MAG: hypothetical protein ACERKN_01410 [Velocimicrobium sp.]